jgi:threonine/homoserine/homoserine lactone efflux protein
VSRFTLFFITTLGLTVLSIVILFVLAIADPGTPAAMDLSKTCSDSWKAGTAALFGLIGGKLA